MLEMVKNFYKKQVQSDHEVQQLEKKSKCAEIGRRKLK